MLNTKIFPCLMMRLFTAVCTIWQLLFALFGGKSTTKTANKKKKRFKNYNSLRCAFNNVRLANAADNVYS